MDDFVRVMLDGARIREHLAYKMYINLSQKARSMPIKRLFENLAAEELRHEAILAKLDLESLKADTSVAFDSATILKDVRPASWDAIAGVREALAFAVSEEEKDRLQYESMVRHLNEGAGKETFKELSKQELKHKLALLELLDKFQASDWSNP